MKALKDISDKISEKTDKYGLANPIEVANEALGGETREESKARREKMKEMPKEKKMRSGGTASSRADGCAQRGKTRGKIV
jgi:hypothetical protein